MSRHNYLEEDHPPEFQPRARPRLLGDFDLRGFDPASHTLIQRESHEAKSTAREQRSKALNHLAIALNDCTVHDLHTSFVAGNYTPFVTKKIDKNPANLFEDERWSRIIAVFDFMLTAMRVCKAGGQGITLSVLEEAFPLAVVYEKMGIQDVPTYEAATREKPRGIRRVFSRFFRKKGESSRSQNPQNPPGSTSHSLSRAHRMMSARQRAIYG